MLVVDDNAVNRRILRRAADALADEADRGRRRRGGARRAARRRAQAGNPFVARAARRQHARHGRLRGGRSDRRAAGAGRRDHHDAHLVGPVRRRGDAAASWGSPPTSPSRSGRPSCSTQIHRVLERGVRRRRWPRPSHRPRPVRSAVRPAKVLLAEDNVVNQRVAVGLLTRRGHTRHGRQQRPEALDDARRASASTWS